MYIIRDQTGECAGFRQCLPYGRDGERAVTWFLPSYDLYFFIKRAT